MRSKIIRIALNETEYAALLARAKDQYRTVENQARWELRKGLDLPIPIPAEESFDQRKTWEEEGRS